MPTNAASKATAPRMRSASAASVASASGICGASVIEPALQNDLGGDLIANFASLASAGACLVERSLCQLRGPTLVGELDGHLKAAGKFPRELLRARRHGVRHTVGVHRDTYDQHVGTPLLE